MSGLLRILLDDWRKNYRHHGGLAALGRCWAGHRRLVTGRALAEPDPPPALDCTVFSVVPEMSALWAVAFERVLGVRPLRILLGDCSGALPGVTDHCRPIPMLNVHHGDKLDLLFEHLVRSDVVLVTDDDIFWLDDAPLTWALERLDADPQIAVVSLRPKEGLSSVLRGKVERAMGSVLVIRRSIWEQERLSFRTVHPPHTEESRWHYDTGEFAQVELGRRGYRVEFAPDELQRHLVFFEGISSWTLKLQKYAGHLQPVIDGVTIRQEKALATIHVLRVLADLLAELWGEDEPAHLVDPAYLERARQLCEVRLGAGRAAEIADEVAASLDVLGALVRRLNAEEPLGAAVAGLLHHRAHA